jgi:predicted aconitase with swiveling domain
MPANTLPPPSIFHMLERNVGKRVLVILNQSYGFEGVLTAITHEPPGVWLSNAEAVVFRATIVNPIPQITTREDRSEIFLNLNAVQRIEVLHEGRE